MKFLLTTKLNTVIGNGEIKRIDKHIKNFNLKKILLAVDSGLFNSKIWKSKYEKILTKKLNIFKTIIISGKNEPTYSDLSKYLKEIKNKKFDGIIGIGGGSCMDVAKAISVLLKNKGSPIKYRGFDKLKHKGITCILIPTTCGTGSEASFNASFVNSLDKIKMGINGKFMFCDLSILDAEITTSCPKNALVGSALDALVHSVEGFICKNNNIITDMLAKEAIKLIYKSILTLSRKKINLNDRLNLLVAAHLSGIIQMNSGSGIASAISYPLSVYFKIPHGIGGGMFLLEVAKYNVKNGFKKYEQISKFLELKDKSSLGFIKEFDYIYKRLSVPKYIGDICKQKIDKNQLLKIMKRQQNAFNQNPIKLDIKKDFSKFIKNFL